MRIMHWLCSAKDEEDSTKPLDNYTSKRNKSRTTSTTSTTTTATKKNRGIMSSIAATILGQYHDHKTEFLHHEVGSRHRLSYADLDALLDREEKELAIEKERQLQLQKQDHKNEDAVFTIKAGGPEGNLQNPFFKEEGGQEDNKVKRDSAKSSSGSDSEDESDWHQGGEHEEDLLLELEESEIDSIQTVTDAEDHLVKDIDAIVHSHISDVQLTRMKKMLGVNCLHRGNIVSVKGKRWMVAVDGSEASKRAFQGVLKLMNPLEDHLLIVTVRDKNLPQRFALSPSEEIQLRFELWKSARHILKPFTDELATHLESSQYTVMAPDAWDARRMLCNLCKRYNIDTLCVGKHAKTEHNRHHWHLRSLHSYTNKHAHCQVIVF